MLIFIDQANETAITTVRLGYVLLVSVTAAILAAAGAFALI
jgi:hypothetical protein